MIKALTRDDFKILMEDHYPTDEESPLWIPEFMGPGAGSIHCEWFIQVPCLMLGANKKTSRSDYWSWCSEHLEGYVRCFVSNPDLNYDFWGFTNQQDITLWTLKWVDYETKI